MTRARCPICNSEYTEEVDNRCSTCSWNLTYYSQSKESLREKIKSFLPGEGEKVLESAELWARSKWYELDDYRRKLADSERKREELLSQLAQGRVSSLQDKLQQLEGIIEQEKQARTRFEDEQKKQLDSFTGQLLQLQKAINDTKAQLRFQLPTAQVSASSVESKEGFLGGGGQEDVNLSEEEAKLVAWYPQDFDSLSHLLTKVAVSPPSIERIFSGVPTSIIFEQSRRGDYLIVSLERGQYLVPGVDFQINQHNLRIVQAVFELLGYGDGKWQNFRLVKPGEVYPKDKNWELAASGILQFDSRG